MRFNLHRRLEHVLNWKSIGKIIYCFIDRNIMMGVLMVSEFVMMGGLGSC